MVRAFVERTDRVQFTRSKWGKKMYIFCPALSLWSRFFIKLQWQIRTYGNLTDTDHSVRGKPQERATHTHTHNHSLSKMLVLPSKPLEIVAATTSAAVIIIIKWERGRGLDRVPPQRDNISLFRNSWFSFRCHLRHWQFPNNYPIIIICAELCCTTHIGG